MRKIIVFFLGGFVGFITALLFLNFILMPILTKIPRTVLVPNLIGLSQLMAESQLKKVGLAARIKELAFSPQYSEGVVIAQSPMPGVAVKKGKIVDLTLSKGRGKTIVPSFQGKTIEDFLSILTISGLTGRIETVYGEKEGEILSVLPPPGTIIEKGKLVRILFTQKEGFVTMPTLIGLSLPEVKKVVESLSLVLDEVREQESEEAAGKVIFQYPEEGLNIKKGEKVMVILGRRR